MATKNQISQDELELADKVEKFSYSRPFSDEEFANRKTDLSSFALQMKAIEEAFAEQKAKVKKELDPLKRAYTQTLHDLHYKVQPVTEDCAVFFDYALGLAMYYNAEGEMVGSRPMTQAERQRTVFGVLREGTNS